MLTLCAPCVSSQIHRVSEKPQHPPVEKFRPCVACLMVNAEGRLLICERRDFAGSWQFPQGGRDYGETPRQTLARELVEEISVPPESYDILEERRGYRYRFPQKHRRRGRYAGQRQIYFRCRFHGPDSLINLATAHPEFRSYRWIQPAEFDLRWLPEFKRDVYRKVLRDFFNIEPLGVEAPPSAAKA
jgi:putative (di)nucleoside polyphosphate hydrolase